MPSHFLPYLDQTQNADLIAFRAQSNQIYEQTAVVLGLTIPIGLLELVAGVPVFPKNPRKGLGQLREEEGRM